MTTRFSALIGKVNSAVLAHLADATADLGGGVTVDGLFRTQAVDSFGLVQGDRSSFEATSVALTSVSVGSSMTINSTSYVVAAIHPGDSGMTVIELK